MDAGPLVKGFHYMVKVERGQWVTYYLVLPYNIVGQYPQELEGRTQTYMIYPLNPGLKLRQPKMDLYTEDDRPVSLVFSSNLGLRTSRQRRQVRLYDTKCGEILVITENPFRNTRVFSAVAPYLDVKHRQG